MAKKNQQRQSQGQPRNEQEQAPEPVVESTEPSGVPQADVVASTETSAAEPTGAESVTEQAVGESPSQSTGTAAEAEAQTTAVMEQQSPEEPLANRVIRTASGAIASGFIATNPTVRLSGSQGEILNRLHQALTQHGVVLQEQGDAIGWMLDELGKAL